jgi:hypothetical protein
MVMLKTFDETMLEQAAYNLVRRGQAAIANYQQFSTGDLTKYLDRDAFQVMAERLADQYFRKSAGLALHENVVTLYQLLLVMAPILQRLPFSFKFDWHCGHLLGFVRCNANGKVGRFHAAIRESERQYQPRKLAANLEALGVHDDWLVEILQDLYRRHYGGATLQHQLAHQLFDPILLVSERQGYELRYSNQLLCLEKHPFNGSIDLRCEPLMLLDFSVRSEQHHGGRHLEIYISEKCLSEFRVNVTQILESKAAPEYKLNVIKDKVQDFVERTRSARSALQQITELKIWLSNKLRRLAGTVPEAGALPNLLVNIWLQKVDSTLYVKRPNFFLDSKEITEKVYRTFFSPYREVLHAYNT